MTSRDGPHHDRLTGEPLESGGPQPGELVQARFTKWGGGPHWQWQGRYQGADEFGRWFASAPGTRCTRPGVSVVEPEPWVTLMPREGAWVAGFYPPSKPIRLYVDMATVPVWRPLVPAASGGSDLLCWEVTMVDLDLDVVLTRDGDLFVDDEDEFAEHQIVLAYPPEVVALAERTAQAVSSAVAEGREPFASVGFERLRKVAFPG